MMIEIIKELTKPEDSENMTIEQILAWVRRVETQKAKSAIVSKASEIRDFNNIITGRKVQRQIEVQLGVQMRMPVKQKCSYTGSSHLPR